MLKDKIIVITGGAGLLGREFSKSILANGGIPIIADSNEELGKEAAAELSRETETEVPFFSVDITSSDSIQALVRETVSRYTKIDAVVSNAYPRNSAYGRSFWDVESKDFNENVAMHLGGYFTTAQGFARHFMDQGYGNIVLIGSIYGVVAPNFDIYEGTSMTMPVEYSVIKSGIIHLTRYLARFLAGNNIRVNCLSPGGIENGQDQNFLKEYRKECLDKGMLDPQDLSGALLYLLSDAGRYTNGQNLIVDDGFTL